nr:uncharacterized protein LOC123759277 [Procambarus clarkii]
MVNVLTPLTGWLLLVLLFMGCCRPQLRQVSWCVTVVVVSDDLAFLATFARTSNNSRLLVPETRLLAITRQPLVQLEVVKETFSLKNAMFLVVNTSSGSLRCGVYLQVPYSPLDAQALQVASWTPQRGLALTSSLPLFPDKFSRFLHRPNLRVVSVESTSHRLVLVDDPEVPGKKRITFEGIMANVNDYLAKALNFTYTYVMPADGSWGIMREDGSFSGMMGLMTSGTGDIGLGPFGLTPERSEVVDFTYPLHIAAIKILASGSRAEGDTWSFLLPLAPLVWVATLSTLAILLATYYIMSSCVFKEHHMMKNAINLVRIFLQQADLSITNLNMHPFIIDNKNEKSSHVEGLRFSYIALQCSSANTNDNAPVNKLSLLGICLTVKVYSWENIGHWRT